MVQILDWAQIFLLRYIIYKVCQCLIISINFYVMHICTCFCVQDPSGHQYCIFFIDGQIRSLLYRRLPHYKYGNIVWGPKTWLNVDCFSVQNFFLLLYVTIISNCHHDISIYSNFIYIKHQCNIERILFKIIRNMCKISLTSQGISVSHDPHFTLFDFTGFCNYLSFISYTICKGYQNFHEKLAVRQ